MFKIKLKKIISNLKSESGFTIMETLVAIFILLISTTGPMVFSQNSLRAAFQSRDQITAFYLAQDAIEFVKNRRDHNVLDGEDWLEGFDKCDYQGANSGCSIDTTTDQGEIEQCNPGNHEGCLAADSENDEPLILDDIGYFTTDSSGEDSIFSRTIYMDELVDNVETEVVVKVRWTSHDTIGVREITVVENIYNWPSALGI